MLGAVCATRLPPCLNLLKGHLVPVGGAHQPLRRYVGKEPEQIRVKPKFCSARRVRARSRRRTLESLPVSIGHFDVDAEDRATLSQHLLLSELRKAAALADRIQLRRGDSEYETFSTREGNSGRDPSGILDNWIHAKLARTIREVKSILVAADRFDSNSDNFVRRQLLLRQ